MSLRPSLSLVYGVRIAAADVDRVRSLCDAGALPGCEVWDGGEIQQPHAIVGATGSLRPLVTCDGDLADGLPLAALHEAVAVAGTVVTGDARGPDAWALTVARTAGRRWASYALDGLVRRGHGAPTAWTSDAPPERRDGRALWAAWCLHRDRVIVRDASRAHAAGRSVRVLALVAPWSATHGTEYTVARARAAGLEVYERVFGEGYHDGAAEEIDALKTPCFQRYRNNRIPSD